MLFDISASQSVLPTGVPHSAYGVYSFVTTSTGRQYFIFATVHGSGGSDGYGASILDLTDFQRYFHAGFTSFPKESFTSFNFTAPGYAFAGLPPENLDVALSSDIDGVIFNLRTHATSQALYYAGTGAFKYVTGTVYDWALPACKTSGSITLPPSFDKGPETIQLDASASLTWYQRLWGDMALRDGTGTYFHLFFDQSDLILCAYAIQSAKPRVTSLFSMVRARQKTALSLVPLDVFAPSLESVWVSPRTGRAYPLKWLVGVEGRGVLEIVSVVQDQELGSPGGGNAGYVGFVTFDGVFDGKNVTGFGAIETWYVVPR